jgi:hypothetical protein
MQRRGRWSHKVPLKNVRRISAIPGNGRDPGGHASRFDPRELARMIGRDIQFEALGRRLKCKRCNHKGRAAVILSDQRWIGRD